MDFTITVDANLVPVIDSLLGIESREEYLSATLKSFLTARAKYIAIEQINSAKVEELDTFVTAVTTVKETFRAAELVKVEELMAAKEENNII